MWGSFVERLLHLSRVKSCPMWRNYAMPTISFPEIVEENLHAKHVCGQQEHYYSVCFLGTLPRTHIVVTRVQ
jgi:hypothetical protein